VRVDRLITPRSPRGPARNFLRRLLFQVTAEAPPPGGWVIWQVAADPGEMEASAGLYAFSQVR